VRVTVGETDTNFDDPPEDEICDYLPGQPPADIDRMNIYEMEIHGLKIKSVN